MEFFCFSETYVAVCFKKLRGVRRLHLPVFSENVLPGGHLPVRFVRPRRRAVCPDALTHRPDRGLYTWPGGHSVRPALKAKLKGRTVDIVSWYRVHEIFILFPNTRQ